MWNRLISVSDGDTLVASYMYDARNHRIKKTVGNETRLYYFNQQWQCVEERVGTTVDATWIYGLRYIDDVVCSVKNTEVLYALQDPNWNVVALVTPSGSVAERMTYDSFGRITFRNSDFTTKVSSSYGWNKTFTGQVYDVETGLMLYRNRYYHPTLGRFITRDPIGYRGKNWNLYPYVRNSFPNYTDMLGLWGESVHYGLTRDWLGEIVPQDVATAIASADESTDDWFEWPKWVGGSNISPSPSLLGGDQSWHFNRNPVGEMDSRACHARENLDLAIEAYCKRDFVNAWMLLGQGLHAKQDIYAHGDFGRDDLFFSIWIVHNAFGSDLLGRGGSGGYPDDPGLDMGTIRTDLHLKLLGAILGLGLNADYAIFYPGTHRIEATEQGTLDYINEFRDKVKHCEGPLSPQIESQTLKDYEQIRRMRDFYNQHTPGGVNLFFSVPW